MKGRGKKNLDDWLVYEHDEKLFIFYDGGEVGSIIERNQTQLMLAVAVLGSQALLLGKCVGFFVVQEQFGNQGVTTTNSLPRSLDEGDCLDAMCDAGHSSTKQWLIVLELERQKSVNPDSTRSLNLVPRLELAEKLWLTWLNVIGFLPPYQFLILPGDGARS